jgi:ribosomal protein S18 acetylase RimI-like enzyme
MTEEDLVIRRMNGADEASACAAIMASTDPWKRLGRDLDHTQTTVTNVNSEVYVATIDSEVVGLVIVVMNVPLIRGYVNALAVAPAHRNSGVGTQLLAFAERRIFRESPNVFLCCTSFNADAQRFYQRHGYKRVGVIEDYAIAGADEILMRKTIGPQATFVASPV